MRYYDSPADTLIKGLIDLSDVESVTQGLITMQPSAAPTSSQPQYAVNTKKALNTLISGANNSLMAANDTPDSKCYFELRTNKRDYYFCAKSQLESSKWVKQLQNCCLDS